MMPMKLMMRKWRKDGIMEKLKVRMAPQINAQTLCQLSACQYMPHCLLCYQQRCTQVLCQTRLAPQHVVAHPTCLLR